MIQWIALAFAIVLNAAANILLKVAARYAQEMESGAHLLVKLFFNPYLLMGVISFGLALGAYSYSLTRFPLSVGYPLMTSLGLIIVSLFSFFFFAEQFSAGKIAGTALIIIGVLLVARSA
ncbi:SMR family transporter [Aneurinibacillus sp. REN35]|uniref:SMR family transporter n=1 Tax=Aneurinibacillus sp. REN35 TaxID=3237286 RepID=UPI0035295AAB